ncbi:MAG: hypothetical protein WBG92_12495 [Thiohalocapsa sp.]
MSYSGMRADLPQGLPNRSEVVVNLHPEKGLTDDQEAHARVVRSDATAGTFSTSFEFTAIDTPGHRLNKS